MYKAYTAADWRTYLQLPDDYLIDGMLVFGSNESYGYDAFSDALQRSGEIYELRRFDDEYLRPIVEWVVGGSRYWFVVAYGSAQLSEFLHIGCMFGSKKNILVGNCGGLAQGMRSLDIIMPTSSYATESAAVMYQPDVQNIFLSDATLSSTLYSALADVHTVHRGKMMTCQAMFAEGDEHVAQWARDGYVGVEMEAATVFAVSNHFGVPSAAVLKVIDNLANHETILKNGYLPTDVSHESVLADMFDAALTHITIDK